MKLSKAEIAAVVVTVVFIALTAVASLPGRSPGSSVTVSAQRESVPEAAEAGPAESAPALPLDINAATEEELCTLPGIGETLAGRIIAYRGEHGGFKSPEEITEVPGIGERTYEKLKDSIKAD